MVNIRIDAAKCNGCGTCGDICPAGVFEIVDRPGGKLSVPKKVSECMECHACEYQCAEGAISFSDAPAAAQGKKGGSSKKKKV